MCVSCLCLDDGCCSDGVRLLFAVFSVPRFAVFVLRYCLVSAFLFLLCVDAADVFCALVCVMCLCVAVVVLLCFVYW